MELNALCTTRRQLKRREDWRACLVATTILQVNGNKTVEIEDLMPKTEAEISAERQARFLAWVDKAVAQPAVDEGSH